jgi:hypothetical protein
MRSSLRCNRFRTFNHEAHEAHEEMKTDEKQTRWALIEFKDRALLVGQIQEHQLAGAGFIKVLTLAGRTEYFAIERVIGWEELTAEEAQQWKNRNTATVPMEKIVMAVAMYFRLTRNDLIGRNRQSVATIARQMAMYLADLHSGENQSDIARYFARDHATVSHSRKQILNDLDTYQERRQQMADLERALGVQKKKEAA